YIQEVADLQCSDCELCKNVKQLKMKKTLRLRYLHQIRLVL
ncbi:unnamed protein product, partial [Allacma fusca]